MRPRPPEGQGSELWVWAVASEWLAMLGFQGARLLTRQREAWASEEGGL